MIRGVLPVANAVTKSLVNRTIWITWESTKMPFQNWKRCWSVINALTKHQQNQISTGTRRVPTKRSLIRKIHTNHINVNFAWKFSIAKITLISMLLGITKIMHQWNLAMSATSSTPDVRNLNAMSNWCTQLSKRWAQRLALEVLSDKRKWRFERTIFVMNAPKHSTLQQTWEGTCWMFTILKQRRSLTEQQLCAR